MSSFWQIFDIQMAIFRRVRSQDDTDCFLFHTEGLCVNVKTESLTLILLNRELSNSNGHINEAVISKYTAYKTLQQVAFNVVHVNKEQK